MIISFPPAASARPVYDNSASTKGAYNGGSVTLTTAANATLIIYTQGGASSIPKIDGIDATLLATFSSNTYRLWRSPIAGITAGSHTITGTGDLNATAVGSYTGVTTVSGAAVSGLSGTTAFAVTPTGSGVVIVGAAFGTRIGDTGFVSNGTQRTLSRNTVPSTSGIVLTDSEIATQASFGASSSGSWYIGAVWLS
ncbi:hypothetical protein GMA3_21 [Gordonia phage GMA3]|uniref:Uncharacterized protein n=1 Tax=Gordonia phage GMA3 TaxID=1647284 RepID=A0A0K0NKV1_9CAUD|nr:minor tail protein [Gordonia phage GMA3]AKL88198.1 hypothetical protein GMA3_21 [Gordonia phage GMA3]